jgi:Tfp pilus assembly protein PilX
MSGKRNATDQNGRTNRQRGVALIMALLTLFVLSALAAAIIFVTQTETWSTSNYKAMVQARYAAEAGAQNTLNWLLYTYTPPASMSAYDLTKFPVQDSATHSPIILSAMTGVTANYPDSTIQSAFSSALKDTSVTGDGVPASYEVTAKLLTMLPGSGAFGTTLGIPQTWEITSQGNVAGVRNAQVQVVMRIERQGLPIFPYGVVGLGNTCPDVNFSGGTMDSWNSAAGTYAATHQNSGASIATNGNVTLTGGSTRIYGVISSSSNITIGGCPDGITNSVGGTPWNSLQQLPQTIVYPNPPAPNPMTPNTNINVNSNTCWSGSPSGCSTSSSAAVCGTGNTPCVLLAPNSPAATATNYGNITSNSNLVLSAGTYYINSLNLNGGSMTLTSYPVVINLGGNGIGAGQTLLASQSSTTINDGGIPANLQIITAAGAGLSANPPVITMNGSSSLYGVVYAPGAYVHITGSSQFLGSVIGQKVTSDSSGGFSYDRALQNRFNFAGPYYRNSFSWSKF